MNEQQDSGKISGWLRAAWAALNRPLPGTQRPSERIYVKGRLSQRQMAVARWLFIFAVFLWAVIFSASMSWLCVPGLGGYSLNSEVLIVSLVLLVLMSAPFAMVMLFQGWHICRERRTVPLGHRPWFPTLLLEGRAAVLWGAGQMILAAICLLSSINAGIFAFQTSEAVLIPPSKIAQCNPPHPAHAGVPSSAEPASEKF